MSGAGEDQLFEEALDLIIRLQNDPDNPVAQELARRWRSRGPDHEVAWAEVAELHGMAGKVISDRKKPPPPAKISRRKAVLGGTAIVAASAIFGPGAMLRLRADHLTCTAEILDVTLADGSTATLGPDSAIRSKFTATTRAVELLSGMAFFDVRRDVDRSFQVTVDDFIVTATGTAFEISKDAGFLSVSLDHGQVQVAAPISASLKIEKLAAGDWVSFGESGQTRERGRRDINQVAAWRYGTIIAERETLAAVVAKIGRWYSGRIVIPETQFASQQISGVFDTRDPRAALEAVVHPYGGKVRQVSPWLIAVSST